MNMNDQNMKSLAQVREFTQGTQSIELHFDTQAEVYAWIARTLKRFEYDQLGKRDKGVVLAYLLQVTGYTRQHLTKLIKQYRDNHWIGNKRQQRHTFSKRYTREDIVLLAKTDRHHQTMSGGATKKLFERALTIFNDERYERLSQISISHIYNLRKTKTYRQRYQHFEKTHATKNKIGERRKPKPDGKPGYLRVDTVHQGDQGKQKGVYHINAVDEVTQMEIICSVEKISEQFMLPVLDEQIEGFPFEIKGYHVDNGSEYVNHIVAKLLNKLLIEFTKSRARHSNDNALVESKNGSIVRKHLGYCHIPQKWAIELNQFHKNYLNPYINFHRPCYYPIVEIDQRGKQKKKYPYKLMKTPYEKFKSLENAESYLKEGMTFEMLDEIAMSKTDLEAAEQMQKAKSKLFEKIFSEPF